LAGACRDEEKIREAEERASQQRVQLDTSLQTACAAKAEAFFKDRGPGGTAYQRSHFNSRLNKCFVLISQFRESTGESSFTRMIDIYDTENRHYASYKGFTACGAVNNGEDMCAINAGGFWLKGDDTRPFDISWGMAGRNSKDRGGADTEKEFMKGTGLFMSR